MRGFAANQKVHRSWREGYRLEPHTHDAWGFWGEPPAHSPLSPTAPLVQATAVLLLLLPSLEKRSWERLGIPLDPNQVSITEKA